MKNATCCTHYSESGWMNQEDTINSHHSKVDSLSLK